MIEEVALPLNAVISGQELFPVRYRAFQVLLAGERQNRMEVIRHQQRGVNVPNFLVVVVLERVQDGFRNFRRAQLILPGRFAVDRDEEPTASGNPAWRLVRQRFPLW